MVVRLGMCNSFYGTKNKIVLLIVLQQQLKKDTWKIEHDILYIKFSEVGIWVGCKTLVGHQYNFYLTEVILIIGRHFTSGFCISKKIEKMVYLGPYQKTRNSQVRFVNCRNLTSKCRPNSRVRFSVSSRFENVFTVV